jgi:hypothetical protein
LGLDPEKVKKMAIDAGFTRTQAWYSVRCPIFATRLSLPGAGLSQQRRVWPRQVVPIEASNTAEVVAKYTASPQVR